jgi:uncharacterized protein (TIGR03067 family)
MSNARLSFTRICDMTKLITASLALLLLLKFTSAQETPDEVLAKAKAALKGTWQVTSAEEGGDPLPAGIISQLKHIFHDESIVMVVGEKEKLAQYKIDPTASPKTIDIIKKDEVTLGIYEIEGDKLRICMSKDLRRPTKFESKSETGRNALAVFQRVVEKKPE